MISMPPNATKGLSAAEYATYSISMLFIISLGLSGNILLIFILRQVEHRRKSTTYLMINIAVAHTLICVFGYPIAISYTLKCRRVPRKSPTCDWLAFVNATTGISSIMSFAVMSITQCRRVTQHTLPSKSLTKTNQKFHVMSITGIWATAVLLSIPPMFGWSTFVPLLSGTDCHPNWASEDPTDKAYALFLVIGGYFIPLGVIIYSYSKTYRFMKDLVSKQQRDRFKRRTLAQQKKLIQVLVAATLAFLLSWTPYCVVSLGSTISSDFTTPLGFSLIPQLMAKASVITNPLIYFSLTKSFRSTLVKLTTQLLTYRKYVAHGKLTESLELHDGEDAEKLKGKSKK